MNYIIFFFLFNTLSHYDGNAESILRSNDIQNVKCYNYAIVDGAETQDSSLTVERNVNKAGHTLETILYDTLEEMRSVYAYEYKHDTILQE